MPTLSRRSSKKSSLGRLSDLEPVLELSSSSKSSLAKEEFSFEVETPRDGGRHDILEYPTSEDEDEIDPELLGLDASYTTSLLERSWSSAGPTRASYNASPSGPQYTHQSHDSEDYFFGTQPDVSPLTSTFFPPERTSAFHLPYPTAYRPTRSASVSDTPSVTYASEESHSSGSLSSSATSSVPVTPLSPALAEIVDAVAKVAVVTPKQDRSLLRQTSLHSIHENSSYDGRQSFETEYYKRSLSHFPLPPQNAPPIQQNFPRTKHSLSNISEVGSARSQDFLRIDTTVASHRSPDESLSSLELSTSPRSLSAKSSFDHLSILDRRSSATPVPQSGGGLARLLNPKRSSSKLEKAAKAHSKAMKLEQKIRAQEDKDQHPRSRSSRESTSILNSIWSPKSPKSSKSDEKKQKRELEKQMLRGVAEEAKIRAENRGLENHVGMRGENWAVSGVGGL
ncbi:hypothetical protein K439DRAFT_119212 [Ramaria rubella]|nr:hypothetical protein K439DRAFT_119212 [Ramaria rubella]